MKNIEKFIKLHREHLNDNPYAYLELGYTRQTDYMAWLCDRCPDGATGRPEPGRKVLALGQGETLDQACKRALEDYAERQEESK
jgi:hypothetical protein